MSSKLSRLAITVRYQALYYEKEGGYYRWDGQLPKQVYIQIQRLNRQGVLRLWCLNADCA
ncbi:hypothetical protein [Arsenophonus endosymbiont of Bemisia tabaci]|uniref:hypothetical protein n=1 Tax=Arsenophonus endosymbiont of Bemisia tabaci TaxID=536059 RepID=UPI0015F635DB|nr:hypothetical protein [Arsenophonus endosymbiont of Bemisia tabaci]